MVAHLDPPGHWVQTVLRANEYQPGSHARFVLLPSVDGQAQPALQAVHDVAPSLLQKPLSHFTTLRPVVAGQAQPALQVVQLVWPPRL